jgi:hypothetical protein
MLKRKSRRPVESIMALADTFEKHGRYVIRDVLRTDPDVIWDVAAKYMHPSEARRRFHPDAADAEVDWLAERVLAQLRRGTPDEGKPPRGRMH